jgi:hypothetical protein
MLSKLSGDRKPANRDFDAEKAKL